MWSEERDRDLYKLLCYVEYQVSGRTVPKASKSTINHPSLTFQVAQTILPEVGKRAPEERRMTRLTAAAWQPFCLTQVSGLLAPTRKGKPLPQQDPGPELANSLHWPQYHHPLTLHSHNPGYQDTAASYTPCSASDGLDEEKGRERKEESERLLLEILSQSQTSNIPGPHHMGGFPKTFLCYGTEQISHRVSTCKPDLDISLDGDGRDAKS